MEEGDGVSEELGHGRGLQSNGAMSHRVQAASLHGWEGHRDRSSPEASRRNGTLPTP